MRHRFVSRLAAAGLLGLLAAAPAAAQFTNQSDVTGPIVTGSGGAGGSFQGPGLNLMHPVFAEAGGRIVFATRDVGCAVRDTVEALHRGNERGEFVWLSRPRSGDGSAAAALAWALLDEGDARTREAVRAALMPAAGGERYAEAVDEAVEALAGLFAEGGECPPDDDRVSAERWHRAFHAFDRLVDALPDEVLRARPPVLLALHSLLVPVLEEAIEVGERTTRRSRGFE